MRCDCSCPDYKFVYAYANTKKDASFTGPNSLNKCNGARPVIRNPGEKEGMCKHLLSLRKYVLTSVEKIQKTKKSNLFEALDELSNIPQFDVDYYDQ